jgi:hypothetical protein
VAVVTVTCPFRTAVPDDTYTLSTTFPGNGDVLARPNQLPNIGTESSSQLFTVTAPGTSSSPAPLGAPIIAEAGGLTGTASSPARWRAAWLLATLLAVER